MNLRFLINALSLAFITYCLCACAAGHIYPRYSSPEFSINQLSGKKSLLVVSDEVDVRGFKRSFASAYRDGEGFSNHFSSVLADSLNQPGSGISIKVGNPRISALLEKDAVVRDSIPGLSDSSQSTNVKYIVNVKRIVIGSIVRYTPGVYAPSSVSGGTMMTGGGTSESCEISFDVEIWDAETMTKKNTFNVSASGGTFLYFYKSALENTVWKSAARLTGYLRNGKSDE